ncbi:MAG: DNA replication and repair protein RecF [Atribacterota bacterium]
MYFQEVQVRNFRNLRKVEFNFIEGCIFLVGDNAQGKSNFLEALFLLARGFSPRRAKDHELVYFGEEGAFIGAKIQGARGFFTKEVVLHHNGKKEWRVNGKRGKGEDPVWLTGYFPEDAEIVGGAPKNRRDFFDQAISFLFPPYRQFLREYEKVVERRNWLLREGEGRELLPAYSEKMLALAWRIVEWRVQYMGVFAPFLKESYQALFGRGVLEVEYRSEGYSWREGIKEGLKKAQKEFEEEEKERGMTLFGPHRDEICLLLGGQEVRDFASQGERKGVVLALRLAEMEVIRKKTRERVVVLLDDLFSELDEKRRRLVLEQVLRGSQVFVTTTERELAEKAVKTSLAQGFEVEEGGIRRW